GILDKWYAKIVEIMRKVFSKSLQQLQLTTNKTLEELYKWCKINHMLVNPCKTNCIMFGRNDTIIHSPEIYYDTVKLYFVNEVKIPGVWFDSKLKFNTH